MCCFLVDAVFVCLLSDLEFGGVLTIAKIGLVSFFLVNAKEVELLYTYVYRIGNLRLMITQINSLEKFGSGIFRCESICELIDNSPDIPRTTGVEERQ
jgi:hypothetical protein